MVMSTQLPELEDPDDQLNWLNANTNRFEPPDPGFDLLRANEQDLERFGIPPKPDQDTQPALYASWLEMFSQPLTFVEAYFSRALPEAYYSQSAGPSAALSRRQASRNWSGAYITPRDGRMFTQVLGSWRVPTVLPPPGGSPVATYGSSTWVGLDGQRRYLHSTLPQVGTAQFLNLIGIPGSTTEIWIEWWPLLPVTLPMQVVPGDLMMAWLIVVDPIHVLGVIVNLSRLLYSPFLLTAPMVRKPPQVPSFVQAHVSGTTAEWVTERPTSPKTGLVFDLPDYGTVVFNNCYAASALGPGKPIRVETLVSPRLIRMHKVEENPHRAVTISVAERPGAQSVKTYFRP
jgi:hypothetical protein